MWTARACRDPKVQALAALSAYAVVSVLYFGLPILGNLSRSYVGGATGNPHDPSAFMWYLVWWPFALAHGLNPFLPKVVWAPSGFNLAWATGIPGASLLAAPITLTAGPVVAYNILCLLAPPLAAWSAFLLCRHVTRAFWPAMLGGYLFGFSTYELGHMLGHLNLVLTFLIPGCVYLVRLRLDDTLSPRAFTALMAIVLVMQFSFSTEIFATMTLLGVIAMGTGYWVLPAEMRPRLRATGLHIALAYGLAAVALSPYLYYVFAQGFPRTPLYPPERYAAPLHTFLIPTPVTYLGGHLYQAITGVRPQHLDERTAYLGAPLLAIVGLYAIRRWRVPAVKFLVLLLGLICVASLGPDLHLGGLHLPLPWALLTGLPIINHALPARVTVYGFLIAALIAALWTRAAETPRWATWTLVPLTLLSLLPNLGLASMTSDLDTPPLFTQGLYKRYLAPGENILIFPYGPIGNSMLWQAQTGMYFRMAEGYLGPIIPQEFKRWPIVRGFYAREFTPADRRRLISFLRAHDVRTVIVVGGAAGRWPQVLSALGTPPTWAGGVMLYAVPRGAPDASRRAAAPLEESLAVTERGTAGLSKRARPTAR
jgi:hypothetical protein